MSLSHRSINYRPVVFLNLAVTIRPTHAYPVISERLMPRSRRSRQAGTTRIPSMHLHLIKTWPLFPHGTPQSTLAFCRSYPVYLFLSFFCHFLWIFCQLNDSYCNLLITQCIRFTGLRWCFFYQKACMLQWRIDWLVGPSRMTCGWAPENRSGDDQELPFHTCNTQQEMRRIRHVHTYSRYSILLYSSEGWSVVLLWQYQYYDFNTFSITCLYDTETILPTQHLQHRVCVYVYVYAVNQYILLNSIFFNLI